MRNAAALYGIFLLLGCADQVHKPVPVPLSSGAPLSGAPLLRGAHSGEKAKIGYYYSIEPNCESSGLPEIRVTKAPAHGVASTGPGDDYPTYPKDNVRHDCNVRLLPSTRLFYQSNSNFRGRDTLEIDVLFPGGYLYTEVYLVEVR